MTLKEILEQARKNIGNNLDYIGTNTFIRKLGDMGISEAFAAEPTMNTSNPGVRVDEMNRNTLGVLANAKYVANQPGGSQYVAPGTSPDAGTRTLDTGGGDGNGGGGGGQSEADIAEARYQARRREIESRMNALKEYANQLKEGAGKTWESTKGNIGTNYDKLKDFIAEKLQQSLGSLDQADVGVQNTYGRLGGNARRAMENVLTKNNLLAKSLGNAGSSWYQNLQSKSRNEGTSNIFDTAAEEAAKRAAIGTQKGATTTEFNSDATKAEFERTGLLTAAEENYRKDVANAQLLETNYGIDSEAAINEAQANLDEARRQADAYTANRTQNPNQTTGTRYTDTNAKLQNYSALDKISGTINNNYAADKAGNYLTGAGSYNPGGTLGGGGALSTYNPQSPNYFLKAPTKTKVWDELSGTYIYK